MLRSVVLRSFLLSSSLLTVLSCGLPSALHATMEDSDSEKEGGSNKRPASEQPETPSKRQRQEEVFSEGESEGASEDDSQEENPLLALANQNSILSCAALVRQAELLANQTKIKEWRLKAAQVLPQLEEEASENTRLKWWLAVRKQFTPDPSDLSQERQSNGRLMMTSDPVELIKNEVSSLQQMSEERFATFQLFVTSLMQQLPEQSFVPSPEDMCFSQRALTLPSLYPDMISFNKMFGEILTQLPSFELRADLMEILCDVLGSGTDEQAKQSRAVELKEILTQLFTTFPLAASARLVPSPINWQWIRYMPRVSQGVFRALMKELTTSELCVPSAKPSAMSVQDASDLLSWNAPLLPRGNFALKKDAQGNVIPGSDKITETNVGQILQRVLNCATVINSVLEQTKGTVTNFWKLARQLELVKPEEEQAIVVYMKRMLGSALYQFVGIEQTLKVLWLLPNSLYEPAVKYMNAHIARIPHVKLMEEGISVTAYLLSHFLQHSDNLGSAQSFWAQTFNNPQIHFSIKKAMVEFLYSNAETLDLADNFMSGLEQLGLRYANLGDENDTFGINKRVLEARQKPAVFAAYADELPKLSDVGTLNPKMLYEAGWQEQHTMGDLRKILDQKHLTLKDLSDQFDQLLVNFEKRHGYDQDKKCLSEAAEAEIQDRFCNPKLSYDELQGKGGRYLSESLERLIKSFDSPTKPVLFHESRLCDLVYFLCEEFRKEPEAMQGMTDKTQIFTPAESKLLVVLSELLNCQHGNEEGLRILCNQLMPKPADRLCNFDKGLTKNHNLLVALFKKTLDKKFWSEEGLRALHDSILVGDSKFLQKLLPGVTLHENTEQWRYITDMIATEIGMESNSLFNNNAPIIHKSLLKLSKEELLKAYYAYLNEHYNWKSDTEQALPVALKAFEGDINLGLQDTTQKMYGKVQSVMGEDTSIWDQNEETWQTSLAQNGALKILQKLGVFVPVPAINPNNNNVPPAQAVMAVSAINATGQTTPATEATHAAPEEPSKKKPGKEEED